MTSRGHPYAEFQRALKNGNVWVAEAVAREFPRPLSLEDALKLTYLYADKEQWDTVRVGGDEVLAPLP